MSSRRGHGPTRSDSRVRAFFERRAGLIARPFSDPSGGKGVFDRFTQAQPHVVRHIRLRIGGWPAWSRPLRVAFLSDLHVGSHAGDVERIAAIAREAASYTPDLVLFGGDFLNMQTFGGGRIPPVVVARLLAPLRAPLGQLAVLGNHDTEYDAAEVAAALEQNRIEVLNDRRRTIRFEDLPLDIVGLPDTDHRALVPSREIANQTPSVPAIFLAHDPVWWTMIQPGLSLTLAGHTHGGQIRFPLLGPLSNASNARLAWSYGLIRENSKIMYVTSGIGTSFIPMRWRAPPEFVILDVSGS